MPKLYYKDNYWNDMAHDSAPFQTIYQVNFLGRWELHVYRPTEDGFGLDALKLTYAGKRWTFSVQRRSK